MTCARADGRPRRTGPRRILAVIASSAVAAVALAGCGLANPAPAADVSSAPAGQPSSSPQPGPINMSLLRDPPSGSKYFGVEADGAPDSLGPVRAFAGLAGRAPDLIGQYVTWGASFDAQAARSAWSYGALYYLAWEPFSTTVAAIADGASNAYITRFAEDVKAAGIPVALSFGHEMNGNWYPWGTTDTTPASFVAAWRLMHALFAAAGATNVIWVWNPNVISAASEALKPYYPGDSYVDWIGLTGYFPMSGPTTFAQLFGPTMTEIRQFTSKPFIVAETAVQTGPSEVGCVRSLVSGVKHHRDVLGLVWFEYNKAGVNWSLVSRPPVRAALAAGIAKLSLVDVGRA
jgi:mannan endo-1,4-beta-mannosidase